VLAMGRCNGCNGAMVVAMGLWWLQWSHGGCNGAMVVAMEPWWLQWSHGGCNGAVGRTSPGACFHLAVRVIAVCLHGRVGDHGRLEMEAAIADVQKGIHPGEPRRGTALQVEDRVSRWVGRKIRR